MSNSSYSDSPTYSRERDYTTRSGSEREKLERERSDRIKTAREDVAEKAEEPRPVVDHSFKIDHNLVHGSITRPKDGVKRIYVILIDNSGSNERIASHFRKSTEYLRVNLNLIDPEAQFVFVYFSDHCDGERFWQAVDFVSPDEEGEKILISTLHEIYGADGGDAAEAHECALLKACELDFGTADQRHLIMVSDVTGHGMGMDSDRGCRLQQDWQESVRKVDTTYQSFEFIGCGNFPSTGELQKQFINLCHPELLKLNFVNLSHIKESVYRLGIVLNTVLFLIARDRGPQALEAFLGRLYEKWLSEPVFKGETDARAKEAIARFTQFIPWQSQEIIDLLTRVLSITSKEAEQLVNQGAYYL